jgi:hypothetical protein
MVFQLTARLGLEVGDSHLDIGVHMPWKLQACQSVEQLSPLWQNGVYIHTVPVTLTEGCVQINTVLVQAILTAACCVLSRLQRMVPGTYRKSIRNILCCSTYSTYYTSSVRLKPCLYIYIINQILASK